MSAQQFMTIAGRWRHHVEASGLHVLPRPELARCMLMFYAGFSAALDAGLEVAEFEEEEAMRLLSALHREVEQLEAVASRLASGGLAS